MSRVNPERITYVETHGTGTVLGDPIEIAALTQAFHPSTQRKGFCAIGSVKANVGHLDTAAGVAGLIKTIEALKHKQLPPSLHFRRPNLSIDFTNSPFYVNTTLRDWKSEGSRCAGVSSFGIGGTNAHVVVEESPCVDNLSTQPEAERISGQTVRPHLLILSAKTETALHQAAANLAAHLKQHVDLGLVDVAYTLQVGRRAFNWRLILVCQTIDTAVSGLTTLDV
jgi:acyl transferase domain-containing protein